jgi:hypothetical protein
MRISGHSGSGGYEPTPSSTERYAASASELTLTTPEGDKVVLSLSRGSLRASRSEVKIPVDGDLNADELEDIKKLGRIVSRAASDVLRGNPERAAHRVAKADKLDSIQSFAFSLNLSYQEGSTPAKVGQV